MTKSQSRVAQSARLGGLGYALTNQKTGQVLECDDAYASMHGLTVEEFTALDIDRGIIAKIIHTDDRAAALAARESLLDGEELIRELRHRLPDGQIRSIRKIFSPYDPDHPKDGKFEVVCQDVTETRKLQDQLFQTQKMEAIGKLTGGVAHDFNNLLAVILGNLELLDEELSERDKKALIKDAIDATLRGSELTRNMLSFARRAPLDPTPVALNQLVYNVNNWIKRTLPSTITVNMSLPVDLWRVNIDASSAEAGLLNLVLNARDAMPDGGTLTIKASNVLIKADIADNRNDDMNPGRHVSLAVSDTGEGIPAGNLEKIFEPFFTTKPVGSGSGLGLSMLQGFMKQSGGGIRVNTELGVGTTFNLYFRAMDQETEQEQVAPAFTETPLALRSRPATILLVEDNLDVLNAMRSILDKSGYRVLSATSGDEALNIFDAQESIDLLLTDIVMAGELQGTTLARALRAFQPDLPVVYVSGYASEAGVPGNSHRSQEIRLMKPVQRADLLRSVEGALTSQSAVDA